MEYDSLVNCNGKTFTAKRNGIDIHGNINSIDGDVSLVYNVGEQYTCLYIQENKDSFNWGVTDFKVCDNFDRNFYFLVALYFFAWISFLTFVA